MASKDKRLINTPRLGIGSFSILHLAFRIMVLLMCNGLTHKTIGGIYHIWHMQVILQRFDDNYVAKLKIVTSFSGSRAAAQQPSCFGMSKLD